LLYDLSKPNGDVKFISRPSQKFLSGNSGILQTLYKLSITSAEVSSKNHKLLFLFQKSKCVNMPAGIYISYALKLKCELRSITISNSFLSRNQAINTVQQQ